MSAITGWEITEWAVAIGAFLTACGVIWRKVVQPVRSWITWLKEQVERISAATTWVEEQMKPNGGTTLVDKVDMLLRHDAERDRHGLRYGEDRSNKED